MKWRAYHHLIILFILILPGISQLQAQSLYSILRSDLDCADDCSYLTLKRPGFLWNEFVLVWADTLAFVDGGDTLRFTPGDYKFRIGRKGYEDIRDVSVSLQENSIVQLDVFSNRLRVSDAYQSSYYHYLWGATHYIETDPDSDIYLGNQVLSTGSALLNLSAAPVQLRVVHPDGYFRSVTLNKTNHRLEPVYLYNRPEKSELFRLSFIPGSAQMRKNANLKGWGFRSGVAVFTGAFAVSYFNYLGARSEYTRYRNKYSVSIREDDALKYAVLAEKWEGRTNSSHMYSRVFMTGALLLYAANILDGMRPLSIGTWNGEVRLNPYMTGPDSAGGTVVISL